MAKEITIAKKQLVPKKFGLDMNPVDAKTIINKVKSGLSKMDLTPAVKTACLYLLDKSAQGQKTFPADIFKQLSQQDIGIIISDFGEITGAVYMLSKDKTYKAAKFPTDENEKLIDYLLVDHNGVDEKMSAKAGQGGKPSITSVVPVIQKFGKEGKLDKKFEKAVKILLILSSEEKGSLYSGPLLAAKELKTPGYESMKEIVKKQLKLGSLNNIPTMEQLQTVIDRNGSWKNVKTALTPFFKSSGYLANESVSQRLIESPRAGKEKPWGIIHYPITAELIKWLNTDKNNAKELLTLAAKTLSVTQIYLDYKGDSFIYTVKGFSDSEFVFGSPSSAPRPTNNRIGFTMKKKASEKKN